MFDIFLGFVDKNGNCYVNWYVVCVFGYMCILVFFYEMEEFLLSILFFVLFLFVCFRNEMCREIFLKVDLYFRIILFILK